MKTYPLFKVHVPIEQSLANIRSVFDSGFINEGSEVTQLTQELSSCLKADNLILLNSCTSALTLALHLAGVRPGDEVISTPMTCMATNTAIVANGAKIVWADIDPASGMTDVHDAAKKITSKTKAIMTVAWAGAPPNLHDLWQLCKLQHVKLVLDAAHAFDASYTMIPIHKWADYTCYSFQAIKHFTTGDGGALICSDFADFKRAKALKWFGLDRDHAKDEKGNWKGQQWDVDIVEAGFKFNMNNISAAIGLAQLPYIKNIISTHRSNGEQFNKLFNGFKAVVPCTPYPAAHSSYWVYTMLLDPQHSKISRDQLLKTLNAEGIMAGLVHVPNDDYTAFKEFKADLPGVRQFAEKQFSLPCGWWLTEKDVEHIAARVKALTS